MQQAQMFLYANGNGQPPTAIDLDKSLLRDLLFNHSPSKVLSHIFFAIDEQAPRVLAIVT